jgi:hypothetical protein
LGFDPGIAVGVLHNLVWDFLNIALNFRIGVLATDETLCSEKCVLGVDNSLSLGGDTDQSLSVLGEADDGRCCSGT